MKYASVLIAVGCLATAGAQQWQVELVDTSRRPTDVFVRRECERTYVAYATSEGSIRIASRDTIWHYETLDTSLVRTDEGFHFALGSGSRMVVSGVDDTFSPVVVEKSDSVWGKIWTRGQLPYFSPLARAVYSADSVPTVIYCSSDESGVSAAVVVETRQDSVWQVDTAKYFYPGSAYVELRLYDADGSRETGPCFLIQYSYGLPKLATSPWTFVVYKGYQYGGGWSLVWLAGGFNTPALGYDIVAGGNEIASASAYSSGYTKFDRDTVCASRVSDAAVQVDSAGRDLIAYVMPDGTLRFAYKDTRWHYREVPGVTTAKCCDLALDEYGQPLIAYEDSSGLSLAHGIDMLGVEENPKPQASSSKPAATVVHSLPKGAVAFDAMGRRVLNPKSGVYFVREDGRGAGDAGRVRKVVIQR
jgi:hypothetical protein